MKNNHELSTKLKQEKAPCWAVFTLTRVSFIIDHKMIWLNEEFKSRRCLTSYNDTLNVLTGEDDTWLILNRFSKSWTLFLSSIFSVSKSWIYKSKDHWIIFRITFSWKILAVISVTSANNIYKIHLYFIFIKFQSLWRTRSISCHNSGNIRGSKVTRTITN